MADAITTWGPSDRRRLLQARIARGDDQKDCAQELRGMGCSGASQTSVSRWETGAIKRPRLSTIAVLRAYSDGVGVELPPSDEDDTGSDSPSSSSDGSPANAESEPFDAFVRGITDEPFLGPRQAAFVDAITDRIRTGPALSDADDRARADQMRILGLPLGDHRE